MAEQLDISAGARGIRALLTRAAGLDAQSIVRVRQTDADSVEVFVTTPFEVVASRRAKGKVSHDGTAFRITEVLPQLEMQANGQVLDTSRCEAATSADASWPGALPPASGFQLLDNVPVTVVRQLSDQGQALARQFSGPAGPPASLLKQSVLNVSNQGGLNVEIPMRMIFACTNLGLIPGFDAPMDIPRHLRVSALGRWIRVDAPFGSVYHSTRLSLF